MLLDRTGTSLSGKRDLYEGPDEADDSLGLAGWVFDPIYQLLRDKTFSMQVGPHRLSSLWLKQSKLLPAAGTLTVRQGVEAPDSATTGVAHTN